MPGLDVDQVIDVLDHFEDRLITLTAELCTRKRHRLSACTRCLDVCPVAAITCDQENSLCLDAHACTGCGLCAAVCPTGALEAAHPSNDDLLVQMQRLARDQGRLCFVCPRVEIPDGQASPVEVSCLGRLDESLLLSAVACGAQQVWLVDGACQGCPQAAGHAQVEKAVARASALLTAFGREERIGFRFDLPKGGETKGSGRGVSRRGMFKVLARETARLAEGTTAPGATGPTAVKPAVTVQGDLPRALPSRRVLLLLAMQRLGTPARAALAADEQGPFAQFSLGPSCTGCQMCAFFCPTGALTKVTDGKRVGLAFRTSHCANCGLCRDICYRQAAILSNDVDLSKMVSASVDWLFAQEMDAEPWKKSLDAGVAKKILEAYQRFSQ